VVVWFVFVIVIVVVVVVNKITRGKHRSSSAHKIELWFGDSIVEMRYFEDERKHNGII
jgi:hypothetical protein